MKYKAYSIRALTNMHVGSGDNNFGVVDKLVQRDPVTNYPAIYSSSLKGALREYCANETFVNYVFGDEKNKTAGNYRFFQANLLAIPVRSNKKPFFMATTPYVLKEFKNTLKSFEIPEKGFEDIEKLSKLATEEGKVLIKEDLSAKIEEWDSKKGEGFPDKLNHLPGNIALFSETNFNELTKHLPVIARNNLENGQSTNLWYEEIVPRESLFYFIVGYGEEHQDEFENKIQSDNVQIGGNASIGYGFTEIKKIGG